MVLPDPDIFRFLGQAIASDKSYELFDHWQ